ncbi:MAG: nucleotidyltransferase family protein [Candidatus Aenigmarchaeota archaeon]|nr:nucleotidyltransferase family protein [Candidatus Aenigmarchaeota archaeon]
MNVKEIIILAGGKGKRLRPMTDNMPKCLVPVNGKPLLEIQRDCLKSQGIEKIILACGHLWEKIKEKYGDEFIYSVETEPLGTGGAIKKAMEYVEGERFFVMNSDEYSDINFRELEKLNGIVVALSQFNCRFGLVDTEDEFVTGFRQKPVLPYWANMGVYVFTKDIELPDKGAFETETFPDLADERKLKAYKHKGTWITVNTIKDLEKLENFLKR